MGVVKLHAEYIPETNFKIEGNLIYSLKHTGWIDGKPLMTNDVCITIAADHLPKEQKDDIINCINDALHNKFGY